MNGTFGAALLLYSNFILQDCEHCAEDIVKAFKDCSEIEPDNQHDLYECIEDALIATADCIECICEILGVLVGVDIAPCQPTE